MKQTRTRKGQERTAKQPGRRWGMNHYSACVLGFYSGSPRMSYFPAIFQGKAGVAKTQEQRGQQRSAGGRNLARHCEGESRQVRPFPGTDGPAFWRRPSILDIGDVGSSGSFRLLCFCSCRTPGLPFVYAVQVGRAAVCCCAKRKGPRKKAQTAPLHTGQRRQSSWRRDWQHWRKGH